MSRALWITSWYPSKVEQFAGDFIERHAKAAGAFCPLQVIFVVKDPSLKFGKTSFESRQYNDHSCAWIYYYGTGLKGKWSNAVLSFIFKIILFSKAYQKFYKLFGTPSFLHLHITTINSWIALWWRFSKKIPLIVSEQWTGFLPEALHEWEQLSGFQKWCMKKVFKQAVCVTCISDYLAKSIQQKFKIIAPVVIIPNVVDTDLFKPIVKKQVDEIHFIHISTLSKQKNFDEIIEAFYLVKSKGFEYKVSVFCPENQHYKNIIKEKKLNDVIFFKHEVPQTLLSQEMAAADALILYSLYETFGCVIIEANACGLPCIVSDIKIFEENTLKNITALKAPLHQPEMLADMIINFIKKKNSFDPITIRAFASNHFGMKTIGNAFLKVYDEFVGRI